MFKTVPKKKKTKTKFLFLKQNRFLEEFLVFTLLIGYVLGFIILFIRLFSLTIVKGNYYKKLSSQNRLKEINVEAPRGTIFDRKGYPLAKSTEKIEKSGRILTKRVYFFPYASHFVGYVQEANKQEIENSNCYYKPELGDKTGKAGVEKTLDCILRGKDGKKLVEVNALGKKIREIAFYPPKKGLDIKVSLDSVLQEKAREAIFKRNLSEKKIAIVGIKPSTGEVLIYLSFPDFDPNAFVDDLETARKYLNSKNKPLFDRVAKGVYPPGSTFKPFVAIAALEEKIISEKTLIEDTGIVKLGAKTFGNWYFLEYGKKEGMVNVVKAIKRSNDIFFYKVGQKLGEDRIRDWAIRFGFSKLTGIGFEENTGVVPSDFWKREKIGSRWYLGDTYNLSIGQGYLLVTPLQLAVATAAIANNGKLCKPLILKLGSTRKYPLWAREALLEYSQPTCKDLKISKKTLALVKEGMKQACSPGGTAYPFFNFKPKVGCKTGTAQSHMPSGIPHAWFTVFAPFDSPEIVLAIIVEEAGQGSDVAAPLALDILKFYFERQD